MDKIKFIILMVLTVFLYQISVIGSQYWQYIYMFLTIAIWILGTRKIRKESVLEKCVIYGFGILWCILSFVLINKILKIKGLICLVEKFWKHSPFSVNFWLYLPISIFIISKILTIDIVKEMLEKNLNI